MIFVGMFLHRTSVLTDVFGLWKLNSIICLAGVHNTKRTLIIT